VLGLPPPPPLFPPPPQLVSGNQRAASSPMQSIPRISRFQRLVPRGANANTPIPASVAPPPADHGPNGFAGALLLELVGAFVVMVSFVDPAELPVIATLAGENAQLASVGSVPQLNFRVPV
jgi:hypothetical protein